MPLLHPRIDVCRLYFGAEFSLAVLGPRGDIVPGLFLHSSATAMPLQLTLKSNSTLPIEVEGVLPERCAGLPLAEVERLPIFHGREKLPLAEFFEVAGTTDDLELVFRGDGRGVHFIGAGMTKGRIQVEGNAGRHLGAQIRDGVIVVQGNCSDWAGAEMRGGRIEIRGNCGHQPGAAYRGSPRGMRGGELLIFGDAGNEVGARMRRGLIAVGGRAGDAAGYAMLAGTILIFGEVGKRPGGNMRRGTIGLFAPQRMELLPTFRRSAQLTPVAMTLLLRRLQELGFPVAPEHFRAKFDLYNGDFLEGGRGEILAAAV